MLKKLGIMVCVVLTMTFATPRPAHAFLNPMDIFKMIMKACPGLPVMGFVSLPPMIATVPPTYLQKAQDKLKSMGAEFLTKYKTGGIPGSSLPNFKLDKITVPGVGSFESNVGIGGGTDGNPVEATAAVEGELLVTKGWGNEQRAEQRDAMKVWLRQNIIEAAAYASAMQAAMKDMPQKIDDLGSQIEAGDKKSSALRNMYSSRHLLSQVISTYHKVVAMRVQLRAAQKTANQEPKDEGIASRIPSWETYQEQKNNPTFASLFIKQAHAGSGNVGFVKAPNMELAPADPTLSAFNDIADAGDVVNAALETHNVLFSLVGAKSAIEENVNTIKEYNRLLWLIQANRGCNINLLSYYFNNPVEVWTNLIALATQASEEAYNNVSQDAFDPESYTPSTEGEDDEDNADAMAEINGDSDLQDSMSEVNSVSAGAGLGGVQAGSPPPADDGGEEEAIARLDWDIGRSLLIHLYENQDDWGSKKVSFPLWLDQKAQYERILAERYDPIVMHYKAYHNINLPTRPVMAVEENKYYRENWSQVVAAHNNYINALPLPPTAQPTYHCNPMAMPPRPCYELPPMKVVNASGNEIGSQAPDGTVLNPAGVPIGTTAIGGTAILSTSNNVVGRKETSIPVDPTSVVVYNGNVIGRQLANGTVVKANGTAFAPYSYTCGATTCYTGPLVGANVVSHTDGTTIIGTLAPRGTTVVNSANNPIGHVMANGKAYLYGSNQAFIGNLENSTVAVGLTGTVIGTVEPLNTSLPEMPPLPLPPWKEVVYLKDIEDTFYPAIPEPWEDAMLTPNIQAFDVYGVLDNMYGNAVNSLIDDEVQQAGIGFDPEKVFPGGELDQLVNFIELGGTPFFFLDEDSAPRVTNRLSMHIKLVKQEEDFKPRKEEAEAALEAQEQKIRDFLISEGITLSADFDITEEDDYLDAVNKIKLAKTNKLASAKAAVEAVVAEMGSSAPVGTQPRIDRLNKMLNALEMESIGLLQISYQNAEDVATDLPVAIADNAAIEAYNEQSKDFRDGIEDEVGCPIF